MLPINRIKFESVSQNISFFFYNIDEFCCVFEACDWLKKISSM